MEKIERWKLLAKFFQEKKSSVFIKEDNGNLHFCKILVIRDDSIIVENFGPPQREGITEEIYWLLIKEFDIFEDKIGEK